MTNKYKWFHSIWSGGPVGCCHGERLQNTCIIQCYMGDISCDHSKNCHISYSRAGGLFGSGFSPASHSGPIRWLQPPLLTNQITAAMDVQGSRWFCRQIVMFSWCFLCAAFFSCHIVCWLKPIGTCILFKHEETFIGLSHGVQKLTDSSVSQHASKIRFLSLLLIIIDIQNQLCFNCYYVFHKLMELCTLLMQLYEAFATVEYIKINKIMLASGILLMRY